MAAKQRHRVGEGGMCLHTECGMAKLLNGKGYTATDDIYSAPDRYYDSSLGGPQTRRSRDHCQRDVSDGGTDSSTEIRESKDIIYMPTTSFYRTGGSRCSGNP
jgi:hypothetical protein